MKMKNDKKIIPNRNYIIFSLLVVFVVVLTLLFSRWYQIRQNLIKENSIMSEFLVGVNEEEFENYTIENSNVIIYLASSKDDRIKEFETNFKEMIISYGLQSQMIFIDLNQIDDTFFDNLKNNYFSENMNNIEIGEFSNILIMENGKINSILYNKATDINIDDVKELFYNRGIIGQA